METLNDLIKFSCIITLVIKNQKYSDSKPKIILSHIENFKIYESSPKSAPTKEYLKYFWKSTFFKDTLK